MNFDPGVARHPSSFRNSADVEVEILAVFQDFEKFTKSAQSTGSENIGPERTLSSLLAPEQVLSPARITLENNGKIRPQPDRENAFAGASGGDEGIRTLETVSRLHP